jgi:hypothetical protein
MFAPPAATGSHHAATASVGFCPSQLHCQVATPACRALHGHARLSAVVCDVASPRKRHLSSRCAYCTSLLLSLTAVASEQLLAKVSVDPQLSSGPFVLPQNEGHRLATSTQLQRGNFWEIIALQ